MTATDPQRYPYRAGDLEKVRPSQLRVGDLVAHAGPEGSHVYCGDPVISQQYAGYDKQWDDDTYRVEYHAPWGDGYFVNPDRMHVYRVTDEARARHDQGDGGQS